MTRKVIEATVKHLARVAKLAVQMELPGGEWKPRVFEVALMTKTAFNAAARRVTTAAAARLPHDLVHELYRAQKMSAYTETWARKMLCATPFNPI